MLIVYKTCKILWYVLKDHPSKFNLKTLSLYICSENIGCYYIIKDVNYYILYFGVFTILIMICFLIN